MERATGSTTILGNRLRLQFEGSLTFEAWLEAIAAARKFVYFENYVIRDDATGRAFRDALVAKAREGVPVKVVYDWVGCWATPRSYWKPLRRAGVEVRPFNRPALAVGDPFGVVQRNHRKLVVVDGEVAFVGGFCIGDEWAGTPALAPWRDTGVEIRGPAARTAAVTFERVWGEMGDPLHLAATLAEPRAVGDTPVWIVEGEPGRARVYRTLHLAAARARRRIWITDAYFVAPRSLSEALASAARSGVDVRILVPANNNWPWVGSLSRGGYRALLEAGVRIFEWQGPMMHAKTAVLDGRWCRVGSSNLNAASLMGNWEIDAAVLDEGLSAQLEGLFLADLASSVEIILPGAPVLYDVGSTPGETATPTESLEPEGTLPERLEQQIRTLGTGSSRLDIASFVRAGVALGGSLAGNRMLGREDRTVLGTVAGVILVVGVLSALFPEVVGWGVAGLALWFGAVTGIRAWVQARRARREEREARGEALAPTKPTTTGI
jgi:cardiolipin synthase